MNQNQDMDKQTRCRQPKTAAGRFLRISAGQAWNLVLYSCIYMILWLFLLPSGLAEAGMTAITRNLSRERPVDGLRDFFGAMKKNWKQAIPVGICNVLSLVLFSFVIVFYRKSPGMTSNIGTVLCLTAAVILAFLKYYVWVLIVTFPMPVGKILRNSFLLVFLNMKNNLLIGAISIGCYLAAALLFFLPPAAVMRPVVIFLGVCFYPGFKHMLVQYLVFPCIKERMIDPYYEKHPQEDMQLRRELGLIDDGVNLELQNENGE